MGDGRYSSQREPQEAAPDGESDFALMAERERGDVTELPPRRDRHRSHDLLVLCEETGPLLLEVETEAQ